MRLFVAVVVPPPVCREVRRRSAGLRERLPRARWVDPEVLHLTLVFLGEVAPERVAALAAGLGAALGGCPPLALRLAGGGTFPPGRPARVAWVGVAAAGEAAELLALQRRAEEAALGADVGYEPEGRPYHPHVTLARCPSPWPREAAAKFVTAMSGEIGPPFVAASAVLIESKLSPRGARHREVAVLPLGGAVPDGSSEAAGGDPPGAPQV